jgi:deoxycytidine triphosphate deaminase
MGGSVSEFLINLETNYAETPEEADRRAEISRNIDPFPVIPAALLSSEHIKAYAKQTSMIHPFCERRDRLKSASYEINPGGLFIYWDDVGRKIGQKIEKGGTITLPENSISFVQLESELRLPHYIAVRFNLRITHVHRGLLLGTGPLVDPGFHGNILIPLHNLTSEKYVIRADEGLIWMEFTKTSHQTRTQSSSSRSPAEFEGIEVRKNRQPPEYYFDKANKNRPIQSSIPRAITDARNRAVSADQSARRAQRTNQIFFGIGVLAIAGTVVGLFQYFEASRGNAIAAYNLATGIGNTASQAALDAKKAQSDLNDVGNRLSAEAQRTAEQLQVIRAQLDAVQAEVRRLSDQRIRVPVPAGHP